jgi:hypothetical protein
MPVQTTASLITGCGIDFLAKQAAQQYARPQKIGNGMLNQLLA